jgi:hypothetical protein
MDCVVVSWIFNSISPDLLDIIHAHDGITARVAWLGVEQQFLGNSESRALILDAEFRNLSQGDLSIDDYCRKMKGMADALADLGEPINDRTLVLNVLRGLNERFQLMAQLITRQKPFPSFGDVRADLRLAELNMAQSSAAPSALLATPTSRLPPTTPAPNSATPRHPHPQGVTLGPSGSNRGRRRRGGRNQGTQGGPQWPSVYNPWTGSIHMWPGPTPGAPRPPPARPGVPTQQQQHAMMVGTPLSGVLSPPGPAPYSSPALLPQSPAPPPAWSPWTPQFLAQAFSTVSLTPPGSTDWVFDSGASCHIAPRT